MQRTVAYVGNFTKPWCTEVHVAASLESLGHTVVRVQEDVLNSAGWHGLPDRLDRLGADMLLWTRTWLTPPEAGADGVLAELRARGVPSVFFHLDRWWGLDREVQVATEPCFRCDLVVTADGGHAAEWAAAGVNHLWQPPGVWDQETHIGVRVRGWRHPVVFVGSHPYPHPEWRVYRTKLLQVLAKHYRGNFLRLPRGRPLRGRELADLYASASVVVGDSCLSGGATHYWSDRVPETVGRGALLVHPEVPGMADWYTDGEHLATYPLGDWDQLLATTDRYLHDQAERERVAAAGQLLVAGRDTYMHRMRTVLAATDELGLQRRPKLQRRAAGERLLPPPVPA